MKPSRVGWALSLVPWSLIALVLAPAPGSVVTELRAPNGIGFSPDEKTLYVSNAEHANPVWMAYAVRPDGTVGPGRIFADAPAWVSPEEGVPRRPRGRPPGKPVCRRSGRDPRLRPRRDASGPDRDRGEDRQRRLG